MFGGNRCFQDVMQCSLLPPHARRPGPSRCIIQASKTRLSQPLFRAYAASCKSVKSFSFPFPFCFLSSRQIARESGRVVGPGNRRSASRGVIFPPPPPKMRATRRRRWRIVVVGGGGDSWTVKRPRNLERRRSRNSHFLEKRRGRKLSSLPPFR